MKNLFTVIILGSAALVCAEDHNTTQAPVQTHVDHFHDATEHAHNHVHVSPADQKVIKNVQDELSSGLVSKDYQHVSFEVSNGNVTLEGSVNSIENGHTIEERIKKLDGVKFVNNNLKIAKEGENAYSEK